MAILLVVVALAGATLAVHKTRGSRGPHPAAGANLAFPAGGYGNSFSGYVGTTYSGLLTNVEVRGSGRIRITGFHFAVQTGPVDVVGLKILHFTPGTVGIGGAKGPLSVEFPTDHVADPSDVLLTAADAPNHWELLFQWTPTALGAIHLANPVIDYTDGVSSYHKQLEVDYRMPVRHVGVDPDS